MVLEKKNGAIACVFVLVIIDNVTLCLGLVLVVIVLSRGVITLFGSDIRLQSKDGTMGEWEATCPPA